MEDNKQIEAELSTLRKLQSATQERIDQLENQLKLRTALRLSNNGKLYEGVEVSRLKPYIQSWIDQGYTLASLAQKAGLSESTVQKMMTDEREMMRTSTADKLITALGITHLYDDIVPEPPEGHYYEE